MAWVQRKPLVSCVCVSGDACRGAHGASLFHGWWHPGLGAWILRHGSDGKGCHWKAEGHWQSFLKQQFTSTSRPHLLWSLSNMTQWHGSVPRSPHKHVRQTSDEYLNPARWGSSKWWGGFIQGFSLPSIFKLCHSPYPPPKGIILRRNTKTGICCVCVRELNILKF